MSYNVAAMDSSKQKDNQKERKSKRAKHPNTYVDDETESEEDSKHQNTMQATEDPQLLHIFIHKYPVMTANRSLA